MSGRYGWVVGRINIQLIRLPEMIAAVDRAIIGRA
jgi:hypothetical protein